MIPLAALALYLLMLGAFALGRMFQAETDARDREQRGCQLAALRAAVVRPSSIDMVI